MDKRGADAFATTHKTTLGFDVAKSINVFRNQTYAGLTLTQQNHRYLTRKYCRDHSQTSEDSDAKTSDITDASDAQSESSGAHISYRKRDSLDATKAVPRIQLKLLTKPETVLTVEMKDLCEADTFRNDFSLDAIEEGNLDAFVFWFKLLDEDETVVLDSYDEGRSPWDQAAIMMDDEGRIVSKASRVQGEVAVRKGRVVFT